ncbi:ATP-binding cassette domain-containing protein [Paenibacillus campinasensis]|uniref:ATP-binding cassette domain-containing protein n=1 Tax=Paenibacillus campinasensis TaxID=66347 RepID=A0ABW9SXL9_9BACL|nr:oligopeptide/dipeptide ABC transporter ATP-binding protein [Paenibacillus campinasensis]MUG65422.1 ATP-binding cassette domain-containing protein [Paenibacillus campinasensis]
MNDRMLQVEGLTKQYRGQRRSEWIRAVSDVSFDIRRGEVISLVGESGCGKTTLGRCLVRGLKASEGRCMYYPEEGAPVDIVSAGHREFKRVRKDIQLIFQDPYSSLNPRMTVFDIISEPLRANFKLSRRELEERVASIAEKTGLNPSYLQRYPHAFSGGQRQRIGIARALVTNPKLVVCDEAVSALDVSIQAQIMNLLKDLQEQLQMTYLFISHDLSVVEHLSDRVAVMYLGRIVELAPKSELFTRPRHPYTEALLSAVPIPDPDGKRERILLDGEVPNRAAPPSGCSFHPRCSYRTERCALEQPKLREIAPGHLAACHYAEELMLRSTHEQVKENVTSEAG